MFPGLGLSSLWRAGRPNRESNLLEDTVDWLI